MVIGPQPSAFAKIGRSLVMLAKTDIHPVLPQQGDHPVFPIESRTLTVSGTDSAHLAHSVSDTVCDFDTLCHFKPGTNHATFGMSDRRVQILFQFWRFDGIAFDFQPV